MAGPIPERMKHIGRQRSSLTAVMRITPQERYLVLHFLLDTGVLNSIALMYLACPGEI